MNSIDEIDDADTFVVLWNPTGDEVVAARRRSQVEVVALLARNAPPGMVVDAIEAGAAACVTDPTAALVAGYLLRLFASRV